MSILDLLGHSDGEFPRQCAIDLLTLWRNGEIKSKPAKALSCLFQIMAYFAGRFDVKTPVIGASQPSSDDMVVVAQLCEAVGEPIPVGGFIDDVVIARIKAALAKVLREIIEDPSILIDQVLAFIEELKGDDE